MRSRFFIICLLRTAKTAEQFKTIMKDLNIKDFKIIIPKPAGAEDINYGIWLEFHKH